MAATVSVPAPAHRRRADVESSLEPGRRLCVRVRARRQHGTRDLRGAVQLPRSRSPVHGDSSVRAFPGQGGPSGAVRPATPNRRPKGESAEPPPRRPTRADSPTPPVNEKARLDFEAGLLSFPNSPNWTRTSDMRVNSSPLYQLSYRGIGCGTERIPSATRSSSGSQDLSSEPPNRAEGRQTGLVRVCPTHRLTKPDQS